MDVVPLLVTNTEPSERMQPGEASFHHPTGFSQPATVLTSLPANERLHPPQTQGHPMRLGVISGVSLQNLESPAGPTPFASNRRNGVHQRKQLVYAVPVRLRDADRKGYPRSVHEEVVFGAFFRSIRRVRPRFGPPRTAPTEELSTAALEKSILSAPRKRARRTSGI